MGGFPVSPAYVSEWGDFEDVERKGGVSVFRKQMKQELVLNY